MTDRFSDEIQAFRKSDLDSPPLPGGALFLGSSSIRLWASLQEDFPGINVINRGFGGSHIADSLHYADAIIVPYRPMQIMFYAGENDLASGKTPESVSSDFRKFVEKIFFNLPDSKIVFISIKPSPCRASLIQAIRKTNSLIELFVETDARLKCADIFHPMLDPAGAPRSELFLEDGLHMNANGYKIWTRVLTPYLRAVAGPRNKQ